MEKHLTPFQLVSMFLLADVCIFHYHKTQHPGKGAVMAAFSCTCSYCQDLSLNTFNSTSVHDLHSSQAARQG